MTVLNAQDLKDFLSGKTELIEKLLESVGCHSIWYSSEDEIRCASADSTNKTSVVVNTSNLYATHYKEGESVKGDIITLIQHFRKEDFLSSLIYIKSILGIQGGKSRKKTVNPLSEFQSIRKKSSKITSLADLDIKKFDKKSLDRFVMQSHINLFYEGILDSTCRLFEVGYDPVMDRIIFPHFNYDDKDVVVGISGRTTLGEDEIKNFNIPKYFNYIKGYQKMSNLYGFSHAIKHANKNKMLIIHEAEKSTLKHFVHKRNEGFSVSTGCHELSPVQVMIILEYTDPDTEIVLSYDKDVMTMKDEDGKLIGEEFLINLLEPLSKFRRTSYVFDKFNILGEKEAPIDRGVKVFDYLIKYRTKM